MSITNKLREIRMELKMEQNDFADFLGAKKPHYNKWERQHGQPSLEWAMRIAQKTQRPIESFIVLDSN